MPAKPSFTAAPCAPRLAPTLAALALGVVLGGALYASGNRWRHSVAGRAVDDARSRPQAPAACLGAQVVRGGASGLDYRYAVRDGGNTTLRDTTLDATTSWRCSAAAQALGLPFAGLDLMLADDGQTYCFEVNPSPGFSWYEDATGQPIARTLARWLAGHD